LSSTEGKEPKFFYGYVIVAAAFFILVIYGGTLYSFGVFFKPVLTEFGWTRAIVSGAFSLYMLLHGFLYIFTGKVNDRFGPRILITICGFFFGVGFLLMSRISTLWELYLFYGVMVAIGMSGVGVPLLSTIARWFVKRRGLMTGIVLSGVGVGMAAWPPLATRLIANYGWRTSYIIVGIIALVVIIIAVQFLRRDPGQVGQLPDGDSEVRQESPISEAKGFSRQEAIYTRQFWILGVLMFCYGFGEQAVIVHIVPHATDLGISALIAANILAIIGGLSIVGRVGMGSAGDRIGNKPALGVCFIVMLVAFIWLLGAKELWMLYLFAAAYGFGYGGLGAVTSPIVAELFGLRAHGAILGVVIFIQLIGCAVGPLLTGRIFDVTGSYQGAFFIFVALSVTGLILTSLLRPSPVRGGGDK